MVELDGVQYNIKSPLENTQELVDYVNDYCQVNDIKNSKGEVIFIKVNMASPIYLLFWAVGYLASIIQRILYSLGTLTSISASSERQLLNLMEIAGLQRLQATPTIIKAIIYAEADTACSIATSDTITISLDGQTIIFSPAYAVNIAAGEYATIVLAADILGSFIITGATVTEFDSPIDGFDYMIAEDSVPGKPLETISQARQRLQQRQDVNSGIDRAMQAIRNLSGVSSCNIFFNYDNLQDVEVEGVVIPPRKAALYVLGFNSQIAKTYFTYLDRQTVQAAGSMEQSVTLLNGQSVSIYMIPPVIKDVHVQVYMGIELTVEIETEIKRDIVSIALDIGIASKMNVVDILDKIKDEYRPLGGYISFVEGSGYTYQLDPGPNGLCQIKIENIILEESL
jgi:hypothetical protein